MGSSIRLGGIGTPRGDEQEPLVTLVVAMLDEAATIEACLQSILAQDYGASRIEILVYDGGSSDGSLEVARRILVDRPLAAVRGNPRRIQASAWNLGIRAAAGDVIGITSGHAELAPGFVRAAVAALRRTGADMVGGPVRPIGDGIVAEAISAATSSPFGAGGARFRLTDRVEEVDTVYMGLALRETYLRYPFDEEMVRNQDDELSYRLLDAGGRIVCDPAIASLYRSRATLRSLASQYYAYGLWKVRVLQKHPRQTRARHVVPPVFVAGLVVAGTLVTFHGLPRWAGVAGLAVYVTANLAATANAARGRPRLLPILPAAYATLHVAYGVGFVAGLVRFRGAWPTGSLRQVVEAVGRRH